MDAIILSYALDTNGQNDRFRRAAEKHGRDSAVLKALAIGNQDPAGVVTRYAEAAIKGDELRIRSAHRSTAYFDFPTDIVWTRRTEQQIRELILASDVIHLNNSEMAYKHFRIRKPALLHHHGSLFRNNPERMLAKARQYRFQQAVSTIDLQKPDPELLTWLPTAYDVGALTAFGEAHRRTPDGRIRIAHAPTNRELKHTAVFLEAVRQLQDEGLPIDLDLIEHVTWAECMARKAQADILYDQMAFGYGCNAVEAWGMGIPVVAGAEDPWVEERMVQLWGALPYYRASPGSIKAVLRNLVTDEGLRATARRLGVEHVRKYHDEKPALLILADLYAKAIDRYYIRRIPGKERAHPVRFRQHFRSRPPVRDNEGNDIPFVDGELVTDDPYLIDRLRYFAAEHRKSKFGIEEVA